MTVKASILAALFTVLSIVPVFAWTASVEGPDVFGVTKVIATEGFGSEALVVQCDSKDTLYIAYIMRKKEFEDVPAMAGRLLIQPSSEAPLELTAEYRNWNDNYAGVVASGKTAELRQAIEAIKAAKSKINVGADVGGSQQSATFGSQGSTKAMQTAIDKCELSNIPLPPA